MFLFVLERVLAFATVLSPVTGACAVRLFHLHVVLLDYVVRSKSEVLTIVISVLVDALSAHLDGRKRRRSAARDDRIKLFILRSFGRPRLPSFCT